MTKANPFATKSMPGVWGDQLETRQGDMLPVVRVLAPSGKVMSLFAGHSRAILGNIEEFLYLLQEQVKRVYPDAEEGSMKLPTSFVPELTIATDPTPKKRKKKRTSHPGSRK